jgi:hypothetical protein
MSEANHMECGTLVPPFHDKLACQLYEEQAPLGKAVTSYSTPRSGRPVPRSSQSEVGSS